MTRDFAERLTAQWMEARPDLDSTPLAVVVRIMRVAALLQQRLATVVGAHGLEVWEYDMLATLRRNGPDGLPPKQLLREMLLSSGAMTNRIDRLEQAGLVGTIVRLTAAGVARVDPIVRDRLEDAREIVALLGPGATRQVNAGLRRLALDLQHQSW
jgi:DNA-binding MarR family transcriptional regulator